MTISTGDKIPSATLWQKIDGKPTKLSTESIFDGRKVVLFALPGAFTPTCSASHLPGFVVHADDILSRGVDTIACVSVNDAHVMQAWGDAHNAEKIMMLGDGNSEFSEAVGLDIDLSAGGMGKRCRRYLMIVDNGTVELLNIEEPGKFDVSSAEVALAAL